MSCQDISSFDRKLYAAAVSAQPPQATAMLANGFAASFSARQFHRPPVQPLVPKIHAFELHRHPARCLCRHVLSPTEESGRYFQKVHNKDLTI